MSPERQSDRRSLRERSRQTINLVIAWQLAVAIAIASGLALTLGSQAGYSALVGACIGVLPGYYLAGRIFRHRRGATAEDSLREIYTGEFIKIAFTAALFVMAILLLNASFLIVVATYAATVAVNWGALLVVNLGETDARERNEQPQG